MINKTKVGIIGGGNSARALSAYLSYQGHSVCLYARNLTQIKDIQISNTIRAKGIIEGEFSIDTVTDDIELLMEQCGTIFIATTAEAYENIAEIIAPWVTNQHAFILFSGKLCGCVLFENTLKKSGSITIPVIETDSLFACRTQPDGLIWIQGFKQWTLFSCSHSSKTLKYRHIIQQFFPKLEPATNVIQRGCTDFGAHAHPVIVLANMARIDNNDSFLFYYEGLTDNTVVLLEAMEMEIKNVANEYGAKIIAMKDLLNRYYGCKTDSLLSAMTSVPNYKHVLAPNTLHHRFLNEDVMCTLKPLRELAKAAGVDTPVMNATINFSSTLSKEDLDTNARSLYKFGWSDMTKQEINSCLMQ